VAGVGAPRVRPGPRAPAFAGRWVQRVLRHVEGVGAQGVAGDRDGVGARTVRARGLTHQDGDLAHQGRKGGEGDMAESNPESVDQVLARWRDQGIRNVRFELPDMHGTSRSKLVPIEHAERYSREGLNMYGGAVVLDSRSDVVPGTLYNEEIAYADQRLRPDASTAAIVPWLEATGRMICDAFWDDGRPLAAAPRHVFRRVLDRCRELGYEPLLGTEPEFYLLDRES